MYTVETWMIRWRRSGDLFGDEQVTVWRLGKLFV